MAFWVSPPGSTWDPVTCHAFGLLLLRTRQWAGEEQKRAGEPVPGTKGCVCHSVAGRVGVPDLLSFDRLPLFKIAVLAYRILLTNVTPINLISKCK